MSTMPQPAERVPGMLRRRVLTLEELVGCVRRAIDRHPHRRVRKELRQRDLLPVSVLLADEICGKLRGEHDGGTPDAAKPLMWVASMGRDRDRRRVMSSLRCCESAAETSADQGTCMVDVYVFANPTGDPTAPIVTIESEAADGHKIEETSHSGTCDYLWDLFKLLQVPSPVRVFLARARQGNVELLERLVDRTVRAYADHRRPDDIVFSVVFPSTFPVDKARALMWCGRLLSGSLPVPTDG